MRTLAASILVAIFVVAPAQAFEPANDSTRMNHEETLDDLLDSTEFLDESLGPLGACFRQSGVQAIKDVYGSEDQSRGALSCVGGECFKPKPGALFLSVDNCREMVEDIVDEIIGTRSYQLADSGPIETFQA